MKKKWGKNNRNRQKTKGLVIKQQKKANEENKT